MSELKQQYPSSFEKSKGVISEPSNFYRGDSVTFNTTHGELIVIASDVNAIRYASECMMPSYFKVDIARAQDVVVFAHSKVVRQDKPQSEWISVDDDLPPLGENYHGAHYSGIHWNCGAFTGTWDDDFRRSSMKAKGYTHWKSLSTPPKQ